IIDTLAIAFSGDFDNDGLPELFGHSVAYDRRMAVMEQLDTTQIYTARTWESDSLNHGIGYHGQTNLIKTDGVDRIYGGPPADFEDGWYYMSMSGDNSYYFDYELIEDREVHTMDIGYLDDDSLVDVIAGTSRGQTVWEAKSLSNDSFEIKLDNLGWGNGAHYSGIIEDIDNDGRNEFITGGQNFLMSPCEWSFTIGECIDDTTYNRILLRYFRKDYGFKENYYSGSDYDIGDIDGDGEDEIIVCAGCILRVYKVAGNDSFVQVWEMDNDTFSGSHVRVHDFNENGIDEIIWSGASDPRLPLTQDIVERHTYIIENAPLSKLSYNTPVDFGNKPLSTNVIDTITLKALDELPVVIDSLKLLNNNEITLNNPSYPCSVPAYDSLPITFDIYSDTSVFITDTLIVYSNDWYGNVDTIEIYGGVGAELIIDSAVAYDNRQVAPGIDSDDYVNIYFNYPIDTTNLLLSNLDSILPLSNGHTWYDGTGSINRMVFRESNTVIRIWLSTDSLLPTVIVGDTIKPDSISLQDKRNYSYLSENTIITGSFGPTGISSYPTIDHQPFTIDLTFNSIQIENKSNNTQTFQITDITGRVIKNIEAKKGTTKYTPKRSGIYFILDNNNSVLGKSIILR
ncbi:MAG: hypothetical protein SVK54_00970, partial [candidate division WOR-3 bacterium]|nr:hypothetical protein [candidate division WOR-3 bacterium]